MEKETKFSILLKTSDMFHFFMIHNYTSFAGIFGVFLSLASFLYLLFTYGQNDSFKNVILIIGALLFTVVQPLQLYIKAAQQIKLNPIFAEPLHYTISQEGFEVSQKEDKLPIKWEEVSKVLESKKSIIIYLSRVNAYIFPKKQYQNQIDLFKQIMKENINAKECKLKLK